MSCTEAETAFWELLQYPFLWPADNILSFLISLRTKLGHLQKSNMRFWNNINKAAQNFGVLEHQDESGQWNWGNAFTPEQLNVLTAYYNKKGQRARHTEYKFDDVTDLVVAFRHRHEHQIEILDEDKKLLFGVTKVTDQVYVSMWTAKFPKLLGFLWITFKTLADDDLKKYYPPGLSLENEMGRTDVLWFLDNLNAALLEMKMKGFLHSRFKIHDKTVEFRQVSSTTLDSVLSNGALSAIQQFFKDTDGNVQFLWSKGVEKFAHFGKNSAANGSNITPFTLLFLKNVNKDMVSHVCHECTNKIIIHFANNLDNVGEVFSEYAVETPLTLEELDNESRQRVFNSFASFGTSNKKLKIDKIFTGAEIESFIKGKCLSTLLGGNTLSLFPKFDIPKTDSYFLDRQISALNAFHCNNLSDSISHMDFREMVLGNLSPNQLIFVASKCGMGKSKLVAKLASEILETDNFALVFPMSKLLKNLPEVCSTANISLNHVVASVTTLICSSKVENDIVNWWFGSKSCDKIRLELFIDGLDEVSEEFRRLGYKIIKLLREKCLRIRIWITCRDHMAEEIQSLFKIPAYQLVPLTREESFSIIRVCTYNKFKNDKEIQSLLKIPASKLVAITEGKEITLTRVYFGERIHNEVNELDLKRRCKEYSQDCVNLLGADLASVPLHCQMAADCFFKALRLGVAHDLQSKDPLKDLPQVGDARVTTFDLKSKMLDNDTILYMYWWLMEEKFNLFLKKNELNTNKTVNLLASLNKTNCRDIMFRSATIFSLQILLEKTTSEYFQSKILLDRRMKEIVLAQGFIQSFDDIVFCHQSICDFFIAHFLFKVLSIGKYLGIEKSDPHFVRLLWGKLFGVSVTTSGNVSLKVCHVVEIFFLFCKKYLSKSKSDRHQYFIVREEKYFSFKMPLIHSDIRDNILAGACTTEEAHNFACILDHIYIFFEKERCTKERIEYLQTNREMLKDVFSGLKCDDVLNVTQWIVWSFYQFSSDNAVEITIHALNVIRRLLSTRPPIQMIFYKVFLELDKTFTIDREHKKSLELALHNFTGCPDLCGTSK